MNPRLALTVLALSTLFGCAADSVSEPAPAPPASNPEPQVLAFEPLCPASGPVEITQHDLIAPLDSGSRVARLVVWTTWDAGRPRSGSGAFSAAAFATGSLDAPPQWQVVWDDQRPGEADSLARMLARKLDVPPNLARPASLSWHRVIPLSLDGPRRDVESHEARSLFALSSPGLQASFTIANGSPWQTSSQEGLHPLEAFSFSKGAQAARFGADARLWLTVDRFLYRP